MRGNFHIVLVLLHSTHKTVQTVRLTNEGCCHLLLVHTQMSAGTWLERERIMTICNHWWVTTCYRCMLWSVGGAFSLEICVQHSKMMPTPLIYRAIWKKTVCSSPSEATCTFCSFILAKTSPSPLVYSAAFLSLDIPLLLLSCFLISLLFSSIDVL